MNTEEEKYKTGLRRLAATIADIMLLSLPLLMLQQVKNNEFLFWFTSIYSIAPVFYYVYCHYKYGATLGKQLLNIKVVDFRTEEKISFKQAIYRDSLWIISLIFFVVLTITANIYDTNINHGINLFLTNFETMWLLLELLTMLTNKKRRSIQDYIANTVVIKTNLQTTANIS